MSKLLSILKSGFRVPVWALVLLAVSVAGVSLERKVHRLVEKAMARSDAKSSGKQMPVRKEISTGLMSLDVTYFQLPRDYSRGAIEWLDTGRLLLADGSGRFVVIRYDEREISLSPTAVSIAFNRAAMASYGEQLQTTLNVGWLRLNDIALFDDRRSLAVSYTHWDAKEKCYALAVAVRPVPDDWSRAADDGWREIFRAKPCLPVRPILNQFAGHQAGGRLVDAGGGKLWLSIGDYEFDGREGGEMISQDESADYGKILEIDVATGASRHVSIGHRNPQGLAADNKGRLWSTEHGPRGGDELNLIVEGENYGWPEVCLGVDYDLLYWPFAHRQGRHDGYRSPTYAWLPSIGISQLIQVENFADEWDGDLLVGSLAAASLFRLRLDGNVVRYDEPINIDKHVRDMIQDPTGTIWLWTDESIIARIRPGTTATQRVSSSGPDTVTATAHCAECHEMSKAESSRISLAGILGRPVASVAGVQYSPALRSLGGVWTEDRLDAFLKEPDAMAPGTSMAQQGVADEHERARIIDALKSLN